MQKIDINQKTPYHHNGHAPKRNILTARKLEQFGYKGSKTLSQPTNLMRMGTWKMTSGRASRTTTDHFDRNGAFLTGFPSRFLD